MGLESGLHTVNNDHGCVSAQHHSRRSPTRFKLYFWA